jgi:hypothetical protein
MKENGYPPNTYEAQFVKGNISPMGGLQAARYYDVIDPG